MVKFGAKPTVHHVAGLASRREIQSRVTGICCLLEFGQVARQAISRKPLELSDGSAFVAGLTLDCGVRSEKWESVLMFLN